MIENSNDTFLARWVNNELTDEELKAFRKDPEYPRYQKIIAGTSAIDNMDFDLEELFARIKASRYQSQVEERSLFNLWTYGIAATVALLIGFYVFFNQSTTLATGFGEQMAFDLPDQSEVILNAKSSVNYDERGWDGARKIDLRGEAFFKVKKGSRFTVDTEAGRVAVLGTQFNVLVQKGLFEVACFEGKVEVETTDGQKQILLPGKIYRKLDGNAAVFEDQDQSAPGWTEGKSSFKSMPVIHVLSALENQYGIKVIGKPELSNQNFSGSFPHDNLQVALKLVLGSLQINYSIKGNQVILEGKS